MKRLLKTLPTTLLLTVMLISELNGNISRLIFSGFLFLADVYLVTKE